MIKVQSVVEVSEGEGKVLVRNVQNNNDEVILEVIDSTMKSSCTIQAYGHELIVAIENAMNYYREK